MSKRPTQRSLLQAGLAVAGIGVLGGLAALARSARAGAQRRRQLLDGARPHPDRQGATPSTGPFPSGTSTLGAGAPPAAGQGNGESHDGDTNETDETDDGSAGDDSQEPPAPAVAPAPPGAATNPAAAPAPTAALRSPVGPSGKMARNLELARMGTRVGRHFATSSAREVFAGAERRAQLRADRQLRSTAEVVETLGSMKGAFMKLGQMASYLDAGLPPEVRQTLAALQANAPPMSAELAASVIEAELGASPERVFGEWDPEPIAAASIGQVHRAMTQDGHAVAVKVQYPGVDSAIRSDLESTAMLLSLVRRLFPGLDAEPLVTELRDRVIEELDYRLEARHQQAFADRFRDHPFIHVPSVHLGLSTGRVLTSELVIGARYEEVRDWPAEERDLAGEAIFRFVFGCLYRMRAFNGDPHPGNYLFHGGGRVTFLDFGLVKWFTARDVGQPGQMIRTLVLAGDAGGFRKAVEDAGFLHPDPALSDEQVADYFRHYYELVLTEGPTTFSADYASETLHHFFDASNPVVKRANVPPAFAILQRINLGLYAVLAGLGATADWRRVAEEVWPWVDASPSTALGRADAEWAVTRGDDRNVAWAPIP
jgi:predicted unusual protein kinase regulating ubiquinone biosynthesis (AarF/ABC1/UbiB family)